MCASSESNDDQAAEAARKATHLSFSSIEWRHYYPANARVPRIDPNIKGDKS